MSKWKCEICGIGFNNFHAQGFENKVYCPLCFFKEENKRLNATLNEIKEYIAKDIQNCTYGQAAKYQEILKILERGKND